MPQSNNACPAARLEQERKFPSGFLAKLGVTSEVRRVEMPDGSWVESPVIRIPHYDQSDGSILRVHYRNPPGAKSRFTWSKGEPPLPLYGLWRLDQAQRERYLICCEGESDTWSCWSIGLPAIGFPGNATYGSLQRSHLDSIDVLYAMRDNDGAGGEAFVRGLLERLRTLGLPIPLRQVCMPAGIKDVNALLVDDPETFRERLAQQMELASVVTLENFASPASNGGKDFSTSNSNGSTSRTGAILQARLTCLADVEPESIDWLWRGRIALGKLTLIAGRPGCGKSFITCDLAARVSLGSLLPDCTLTRFATGDVVMMSCEDGLADTIVPRVLAAGADRLRIHKLDAVTVSSNGKEATVAMSLAHVDVIEQGLDQFPDCKLLVVDPLGGFIGAKVDTSQDNQVRAALEGLRELVERRRIACVLIAHTRKASVTYADDAILGSRAFSGLVRQVWHLCEDDNDRERKLLLPGKVNLCGATRTGLAFRIEDPGRLVWEPDPVLMHADDFIASTSSSSSRGQTAPQRTAAMEWLSELLRNGAVESDTVKTQAGQAGLSWGTVRRAKDDLGIVPFKREFSGRWMWQLPPQDTQKDDNGVASPGSEGPSDEVAHDEVAHGKPRSCSADVQGEHLRKNQGKEPCFSPGKHEDAHFPHVLSNFVSGGEQLRRGEQLREDTQDTPTEDGYVVNPDGSITL